MAGGRLAFTFTEKDLFRNFEDHVISDKVMARKKESRKELCGKLFADTFFEILLDIIKNNVTFVCPSYFGEYAEICAQVVEEDLFKELYKRGSFRDIDFVKSQFKTYVLVYKYRSSRGKMITKPLYLTKELHQLLTNYINDGKEYY